MSQETDDKEIVISRQEVKRQTHGVVCPVCKKPVHVNRISFTKRALDDLKKEKISRSEILKAVTLNFIKVHKMCPMCMYKAEMKDIGRAYR